MALELCTGHCGNLYEPAKTSYCSDECRELVHRSLMGVSVKPQPRRPITLSMAEAYRIYGHELGKYDALHDEMRPSTTKHTTPYTRSPTEAW